MVCFGGMFIELPKAKTREMLRQGEVTARAQCTYKHFNKHHN